MSFTEQRALPGFEPGTSRTLSENHTPRPTSHAGTLFNAFLQHDFKVLNCQCSRNKDLDNHLEIEMGSLFQIPLTSFTEQRARPGFEPGTSRTRSENHTPRPTSHAGTLFNDFLQDDFKVLSVSVCRSRSDYSS